MIDIIVPYIAYGEGCENTDSVSGHTYITISPDATLPEFFTAFGTVLRAATFSDDVIRMWTEENDILDYLCL